MKDQDVFEVLSKIKPGDTLCSDLTIVEHGTWFSWLKRSLYGDTRTTTVVIIENAVDSYCQGKKMAVYLRTKEIEFLEATRKGIQNLARTYPEDKAIRDRLSVCHLKLREFITSKAELSGSEGSDEVKSEETEFEMEEEPAPPSEAGSDTEEDEGSLVPDEVEEEALPMRADSPRPELIQRKPVEAFHRPGSKFEDFLKKKVQPTSRGAIQRERISSRGGNDLGGRRDVLSRTVQPHRTLPKFHVITMGDVVSEINTLPPSLSNPLSPSVSQAGTSRDVTWYVERFIDE